MLAQRLLKFEMEGIEGEAAIEEANKPAFEPAKIEAIEEVGAAVVGTLEVAGNSAHLPTSNEGMESKELPEQTEREESACYSCCTSNGKR